MKQYFEGWYFKHRSRDHVFAAIPGLAVDARGEARAFIQTIGNDGSRYFPFPASAYNARRSPLSVTVGDNRFGRDGISLALPGLRAELRYGTLTELDGGDIMGPFRHVPFMECYHGVDSLLHSVNGFVEGDGVHAGFDGSSGYIERDWGRSFPRSWVWLECHEFADSPGDSVMLAIAGIPLLGMHFTGILCVLRIGGIQHRLATYRGARLLKQQLEPSRYQAELAQGRYRLSVNVAFENGSALKAPVMGAMSRTITEYPCCQAYVRLLSGDRVLLDAQGDGCGFECAKA